MKGIYLASYIALHEGHDIVYQDINGKRDIAGDMMQVDLSHYDYVIATPPCNWWSRGNYRRNTSQYSLNTKHLLIDIINKLKVQDKPFIVENVRNDKFFSRYGLFDNDLNVYRVGRHTYWTNVKLDVTDIIQKPKVEIVNGKKRYLSSQHLAPKDRQGTSEVHEVVERFINTIEGSCHCERICY